MKPPLFVECSVCGREFGSKSIQIHEPQCLQKLRRTEIANQEEDESSPTASTKKTRRKKKSGPSFVGRASTSTAVTSSNNIEPPSTTLLHHHSAPSFVLMATTDQSGRFHSKFNLPKIQTTKSTSSARPSTAVLDKPRILNPEYIQYDMSLTRIDFTGQPTKAPHPPPTTTTTTTHAPASKMDENQNGRLHRQNTQVLDNTIKRHDFALPTVVDPPPKSHNNRGTTRAFDQSKLLPPSGNTVDAALGDPQKQARGDRGLSTEAGSMSRDSDCDRVLGDRPSPPVESLYAAPNFPFLSKLSHCDLEKPLRTCFHLDKMPRNELELYQDNFVTPSASSEFPKLQPTQKQQQSQRPHLPDGITQDEKLPQLGDSDGVSGGNKDEGNLNQKIAGFACTTELQSKELVVLKSVVHRTESHEKSVSGLADYITPDSVIQAEAPEGMTPNWIGKPFMQQHTYCTVSPANNRETDTDSEVYATAVEDSHAEPDLDYNSTKQSLLGVMNELRQILERRESLHLKSDTPSAAPGSEHDGREKSAGSNNSPNPERPPSSVASVGKDVPNEENVTEITSPLSHPPSRLSANISDEAPSPSVGDDCATTSKSSVRTVISQSLSRSHVRRKHNRDSIRTGTMPSHSSDADDESSTENVTDSTRIRRRSISVQREKRLHRRYSNFKTLHALTNPRRRMKPLKSINLISFESEQDIIPPKNSETEKPDEPEEIIPKAYSEVIGFESEKPEEPEEITPEADSEVIRFQLTASPDEYPEDDDEFEALLTKKLFSNSEPQTPPPSPPAETEVEETVMGDVSAKEDDIQLDKISFESVSNSKVSSSPIHPPVHPEAFEVHRMEVSHSPFCPLPLTNSEPSSGAETGGKQTPFRSALFSDDEIYEKFMAPHSTDKSDTDNRSLPHSAGENITNTSTDRRRRMKRPSTAGTISITDSVNVWEGAHLAERTCDSSPEQDIVDFFSRDLDRSPRPQTRRRDQETRSLSANQRQRESTVITSKIQNLISNVNRVGQLHRERQNEAQQQRPKTVPANPHEPLNGSSPSTADRPSTSLPHSEMAKKAKSQPKRKRRADSKSAAPSKNNSLTSTAANRRPGTSTSIRIGLGKNRALTLRTSVAESFAIQDSLNHNHVPAEDEPLELLFSFKKKVPAKKRNKSPMGLATPVEKKASTDKAEFYKQIDRHRREALAEAHGTLRRRNLANYRPTPGSTPPMSSGTCTPKMNTGKAAVQAKEVIRELKRQINLKSSFDPSNNKKSKNFTTTETEGRRIPPPMSKRVTFSTGPYPFAAGPSWRLVKTKPKSLTKNATAANGIIKPSQQITTNKVSTSVKSKITKKQNKVKIMNLASDAGDRCAMPSRQSEPPGEQVDPRKDKENVADKMEYLEASRDKIRTKEFERRKRGKGGEGGKGGDNARWSVASVVVPSRKSLQDDPDEKTVNVKIIVRRKNKDGTYPELDEIGHRFAPAWNYIIIDEEPITSTSPNAYEAAMENRAKAKVGEINVLKITTSEQSTVNSLSSEDAATRFLTCYVCGQTLNVREYFAHEEHCVKDIEEKNKFLAGEDKRELPPKPQGTITIKHWNQFAHDALKHKFITCPFCLMEFLPDNADDVEQHKQLCLERPLPPPPPPKDIGMTEFHTVETALEVLGRVVPMAKEIRQNKWNRGYERVEEYSRPANNRLKKYKRPKEERNKLI